MPYIFHCAKIWITTYGSIIVSPLYCYRKGYKEYVMRAGLNIQIFYLSNFQFQDLIILKVGFKQNMMEPMINL